MQITNKGQYGEKISKQLSVLEDMHDTFREQKDFCFRTMFEEFNMTIGSMYAFINPFKVKWEDHKEYTIKSVSFGADEYAYINCINEDGKEFLLEPYYLDAYDDFENVFSAVYEHLKSEHSIIPNDEFALATVKYLEHECKWATKNNISLESFGKRMQAHTIDTNCELFDFNIGAFVFTISKVEEKYIVNSTYEIYDGNGKFVGTDLVFDLKKRNGICE